jgi:hypothetical protein
MEMEMEMEMERDRLNLVCTTVRRININQSINQSITQSVYHSNAVSSGSLRLLMSYSLPGTGTGTGRLGYKYW